MSGVKANLKNRRKRRFKKRYWLLVDIAVAVTIFALLLYKPARYEPADAAGVGLKPGQVNPYLTYLSSEIYNGAQFKEPFEVVVIEEKINEVIAGWSEESEGIGLSSPTVLFEPNNIILMGAADVKGVELVVTIVLEARVDEKGLLHLQVAKVKVGAMNITPLARMIAQRMYAERVAIVSVDTDDWGAQIAGALLNDEPFEPVFSVPDTKVRLRVGEIAIAEKKITLRLVPAS